MKITLPKDDVMAIICAHFNRPYVTLDDGTVQPQYDGIYWEGNPEIEKET